MFSDECASVFTIFFSNWLLDLHPGSPWYSTVIVVSIIIVVNVITYLLYVHVGYCYYILCPSNVYMPGYSVFC